MEINKEDVKKTALLSRIELKEDELEDIAKEISQILDYVEKISALDTSNIEPTSHILNIKNVFREDIIDGENPISISEAIKNAPRHFGNFIIVPKSYDDNHHS